MCVCVIKTLLAYEGSRKDSSVIVESRRFFSNQASENPVRQFSRWFALCLYRCPVDNTETTFGMTPLDMAILMGDVESTAQLLAAGADPDHLLKLFALTDLYDVTVVHPDRKKTRELLDDDDKVCSLKHSNSRFESIGFV